MEVEYIGHDLEGPDRRMLDLLVAKYDGLVHILVITHAFNPFVHGV